MKGILQTAAAVLLAHASLLGAEKDDRGGVITLQRDDIIPTNSAAFREYALSVLLSNATLVCERWKPEVPLPIATNQITRFVANPKPNGMSGGIHIGDRFSFGVGDGRLSLFRDQRFWSAPFVYSNQKMEALASMTNLLTLESAVAIAKDKLHQLGIDEKKLGMGEPFKAAQWRYDSNGVIYPLPLYVVRWKTHTGDYMVIDMEISGVTSNVADFYHNIPARLFPECLRVPTPTNYLQMLGLPTNVVFRPYDWERRQKLLREAPQEPPIL